MLKSERSNQGLKYGHTTGFSPDLVPNLMDFSETVYPIEDVQKDRSQLGNYKNTSDYSERESYEKTPNAVAFEKSFVEMANRDRESGRSDIVLLPVCEVDDTFNHVDAVGLVKTDDGAVVPFGIDFTCLSDPDKIRNKMEWKHVYGKSQDAPENPRNSGRAGWTKRPTGKTI